MSPTILKYTLLLTLSAYIVVVAEPIELKHCDLGEEFFKGGFNQYQARFSVCYAQTKNYDASDLTAYHFNDDRIFFYGMFPITEPFCAKIAEDSVCGISCRHQNSSAAVLCMKHVFEANLSDMVSSYLKREEVKLSNCMRTIFDECRFSGPGGQTVNGQPIFYG